MSTRPAVTARELTPRGVGGVTVVEFAGSGAREHLRSLGAPASLASGDARLARLEFPGGLADLALVVARAADRIEVHLHGSPALARAALAGWAPRRPSILEERALDLLALACCESAARILLDQAEGALRAELERIERAPADEARLLAGQLARRGREARFALEPARIVLAGPVNAGKSTLFNALAGEARALVADEPGTTRDVLAVDVQIGSWPLRVHDTAGERALDPAERASVVEAEGQRRARALREDAAVVLWLARAGEPLPAVPPGALLLVTQADRVGAPPPGSISALADPASARRVVGDRVRGRLGLPAEAWTRGAGVPFEPRQVEDLAAAARAGDARRVARRLLEPEP